MATSVGRGTLGHQREGDRHVTERQVEVDQQTRVLSVGGQRRRPGWSRRSSCRTPPLAENTVTTRPSREAPPSVRPPSRCDSSRLRWHASIRLLRSSEPTTSRTPDRSAWASTPTSSRRRTSTTPTSGRLSRSCSVSVRAAARSMSAPTTSRHSRWLSASCRAAAGPDSTTRMSSPRASLRLSAASGSASHNRVMTCPSLSCCYLPTTVTSLTVALWSTVTRAPRRPA